MYTITEAEANTELWLIPMIVLLRRVHMHISMHSFAVSAKISWALKSTYLTTKPDGTVHFYASETRILSLHDKIWPPNLLARDRELLKIGRS